MEYISHQSFYAALDDFRALFRVIEDGWNNREIFVNRDHHDATMKAGKPINPGWENTLKATEANILNRVYVSWGQAGPSPESIDKFLVEARAFLKIFSRL